MRNPRTSIESIGVHLLLRHDDAVGDSAVGDPMALHERRCALSYEDYVGWTQCRRTNSILVRLEVVL